MNSAREAEELFREPFRGKIRGEAPEHKVEEKCSRRLPV
jgi:hypothetical protein